MADHLEMIDKLRADLFDLNEQSRNIQARGRETYMPRAQSDDVSVADRDAGSKGAIRAPAPRRVRVMARATSRP